MFPSEVFDKVVSVDKATIPLYPHLCAESDNGRQESAQYFHDDVRS